MIEVKSLPQLRFPEFSENLFETKLGEIVVFKSGGTPPKDKKDYWNGNIPWISASSMNGKFYSDSERTLTKLGLRNGSRLAKENTLLILVRGSMLYNKIPVGIAKKEVAFNQDIKSLTPEEQVTSEFLYQWFQSAQHLLMNMVVGTGIGAGKLETDDLKFLKVLLPALPEQQKIASFLTAVDDKITQLSKKKALLEQYKKGVMQRIFSQEIRFTDENGNEYPDWEMKILKEVATKRSSNISANTIEENVGNYKIYGASGFLKEIDFYREEEPYISIVKDGAGVGRTLLCEPYSSVLGTLDVIQPKWHHNLYFIYCLLNNLSFRKYITGSTIPHIYFKDYSKEKIKLPCFAEQTKIANFLSGIDDKITHVATQIEKTKVFKKGLLQQMFV